MTGKSEWIDPLVQAQERQRSTTRNNSLRDALRAFPAAERQQAIADALAELAECDRRRELMAKVEALSSDDIERLLKSE